MEKCNMKLKIYILKIWDNNKSSQLKHSSEFDPIINSSNSVYESNE